MTALKELVQSKSQDEIPVFLILDMQEIRLWTCLHHMVILRSRNKITHFFGDFSLIESLAIISLKCIGGQNAQA